MAQRSVTSMGKLYLFRGFTHGCLRDSYWHCPRGMRSRVNVTAGRPSVCPSVCLSHQLAAARRWCGFAAVDRAAGIYRSSATQSAVSSSRRAAARIAVPRCGLKQDAEHSTSTSFGWGKGVNVTSAGWQVPLCDPVWHVSSRSGVATLRTSIHLLLTYLQTC